MKNKIMQMINQMIDDDLCSDDLVELETHDKIDSLLKKTAIRFIKTYKLFKSNNKFYCDLLVSMRNYLLFYQTSIPMFEIKTEKFKEYGLILRDNKIYAIQDAPEWINKNFVDDVYKMKYEQINNDEDYNLITDPLIYNLTEFSYFKSLSQKIAVYSAINTPNGYTTLLSLPTGGGKSLITQTLAYKDQGLSIVVVPTVSLAIDQVRAAKKNIKRDTVDNEIFYYAGGMDLFSIKNAIDNKTARLLFISPEALIQNLGFEAILKKANNSRYLKNLIIDEAHIIFDWGASFRVEYQYLDCWRREKMKKIRI